MVFNTAFSQDKVYKPLPECPNHNKFTESNQNEQLKYYSDTILPNGIIVFNKNRIREFEDITQIHNLLQLEKGTTFELKRDSKSILDGSNYKIYQQYYKGVLVDGGGYALNIPSFPDDPCLEADYLSAYVASDINMDVRPSVPKENLNEILSFGYDGKPVSTKLIITHNLLNDCSYHLAWEIVYRTDKSKISWVDAQSGKILKTVDADQDINAPTEIYGVRNLVDLTKNNTTSLESPDNSIVMFDFSSFNNPLVQGNCQRSISDFTDNLKVTTSNSTWTTEASAGVYQSFFVTTITKNIFKSIGIDFKKINIGSGCVEANAFSLNGSTLDNTFIVIGTSGGNSLATFDIIGHELGHTFLNQFLGYTNIGNSSLHEGISDMIGTYIESIFQGNIDWVIGDDVASIAGIVGRDLKNPKFSCFEDVKNLSVPHDRSVPLGHWFNLVSEGNQAKGITGIGILPTLNIVLEALKLIGNNSDYADLQAKTLFLTEKKYGICSNEALSVGKAWAAICVGKPYKGCEFNITGPSFVCEENNKLSLCITNYRNDVKYRWYFPIDWTVIGQKYGNTLENYQCLEVTKFPKYNYYPQYFTIEVFSPTSGVTVKKAVKLIDCNGDDPTCESFNKIPNDTNGGIATNQLDKSQKPYFFESFDVTGRLVKRGKVEELEDFKSEYLNSIIFCVYYDIEGRYIRTEKQAVLNRY